MRVTDPRTLLISDSELKESQQIIHDFQQTKKVPSEGVERLWTAQYSTWPSLPYSRSTCIVSLFKNLTLICLLDVNAVIHPATGEKIPAAFRMSAFVPANVLIAAGLLLPGAGVRSLYE